MLSDLMDAMSIAGTTMAWQEREYSESAILRGYPHVSCTGVNCDSGRWGSHRNAEGGGFVRENGSATRRLSQDGSDSAAAELERLRRKNENRVGMLSGLLSSGFSLAQVRDKTLMESTRRNSCMHVCNKIEGSTLTALAMFHQCCIQMDTITSASFFKNK